MGALACGDDDDDAESDAWGDESQWDTASGTTASGTQTSTTGIATGTGTATFDPNESEEEDFGLLRKPSVSGPFVFQMSSSAPKVTVIHSETLAISSIRVGYVPRQMIALVDESNSNGRLVVLGGDELRSEVALIDVASDGSHTLSLHEVVSGVNAVVSDPSARYVVVYRDADLALGSGAGSDQEISVFDTVAGTITNLSVGVHPRDIHFTPDGNLAYIVTADGVNVLNLSDLEGQNKLELIPVLPAIGLDPDRVEIRVEAALGQAIARATDLPQLWITDLKTHASFTFDLPSVATDLDIAAARVYAMLPGEPDSHFVEIALPVDASSKMRSFAVPGIYAGLAQWSADGESALLYTSIRPVDPTSTETNLGNDPRQRLTIARRGSGDWERHETLFTEIPIQEISITPDTKNAIIIHQEARALNPSAPFAYTLLDLAASVPFKKLHYLSAPPLALLVTPDSQRAALVVRSDAQFVRAIEMIEMSTFVVKHQSLASPPEQVGYVPVTDRIFVSQEHPGGRMTFLDREWQPQTVTGFETQGF
jgi:DNA-binding beta-propeller fold protein YncE